MQNPQARYWGVGVGDWGLVNGGWWLVVSPRSCGTRLRADWGLEIGYWGVGPAVAAPTGVRGRNASPHGRDTLSRGCGPDAGPDAGRGRYGVETHEKKEKKLDQSAV